MIKIENFAIQGNTYKKEGSNEPDHKLSTKVGEQWIEFGASWVKTSDKSGKKYFSGRVDKKYAMVLMTPDEWHRLSAPLVGSVEAKIAPRGLDTAKVDISPTLSDIKYENGEYDSSLIPF